MILFRRGREQPPDPEHHRIQVFVGKRGSMKNVGELVMSEEEWFGIERWADTAQDHEIVAGFTTEDRYGSPVG